MYIYRIIICIKVYIVISSILDRVTKVSSLPSWQQQGHTNEEDGDDEPTEDSLSEAGTSVLNISYILPNSVRQERSKWSQPAKLPFLVEQKGIVR